MRLVDDDRVVLAQIAVALGLGEQDAVGHQLDVGARAQPVVEADLVADRAAELGLEFLRDARRGRARGDAARLGVADEPGHAAPEFEQIFGSCVVLPEPVSPQTITTWCSPIARAMSARRALTGSSSGYSGLGQAARRCSSSAAE